MWNLFAMGGQIMRTADCKNLSKSPVGDFRQPEHRRSEATAAVRFVLRGLLGELYYQVITDTLNGAVVGVNWHLLKLVCLTQSFRLCFIGKGEGNT